MKADAVNSVLLVLTLGVSVWCATLPGGAAPPRAASSVVADAGPAGAREVVDARGVTVPVRAYQRIVSLHAVSDHLLLELVEPERLVAITRYTATVHEERWRFGARPVVERSDQIELVVSLEPDLVVTSSFADDAYVERLREAGVQVFDLGDTLGVSTTRAHIRALGALLAIPRRAERLEGEFVRRLAVLEAGASGGERVSGMYLSIHGDHFLGGSKGTSYADVLHYAGVRDAAAEHGFSGWPQYDPEQLLAIDPSVVVTQTGMGAALRGHSLLKDLRACGPGGRIIEVPDSYLGDPGLGIVEAARLVQDALHR